jgi:hypothetical protein
LHAGTSVILLLKLVIEFWMIVSGCSFAATPCDDELGALGQPRGLKRRIEGLRHLHAVVRVRRDVRTGAGRFDLCTDIG